MWPAATAAFNAPDKNRCLFAIVLPEAPSSNIAFTHSAMSSRDNAASGVAPNTGAMLLAR
jgi:hypothetical protein